MIWIFEGLEFNSRPSWTSTNKMSDAPISPEQSYARLALDTKRQFFPSRFPHPWTDVPKGTENGSVAIIDFHEAANASVAKPSGAHELFALLEKPSTSNRLIILEDLDQRYVNTIGAYVGVPPVVFLAHAAGPYVDDIVDEDCLAHDQAQYWRVRTFQLHTMEPVPNQAFGVYRGKGSVVDRPLQFLDNNRIFHPSAHLVSFWCSLNTEGSWTALLLVDPVLEKAIHSSHAEETSDDPVYSITLQHPDLSDGRIPLPARFSVEKLPQDPHKWQEPPSRPSSISLFDNIVHIYTTHRHNTTSDPLTATTVIRNLLLSTWQGVIRAKEIDYYYLWEKTSFSKTHYASPGSWYSAWERNWQSEYFNALTYHMMTVMNRMRDIDDTFRTLGLAGAAATATTIASPSPPTFSPRELRDWQALRAHATALHERFSHTLATYEQRASVEESLLANKQARNVGRLSALATVLVPFSVIAGIFSMSGEFAAGEDLFWVFWLLAPTVSGMLMVWLFFEKIVRILRGTWVSDGAVLPLHEKAK